MHVHAVEFLRKEGRFVTARAGSDLEHDVPLVVRVLRKKQDLQFVSQPFLARLGVLQFLLEKAAHVLVLLLFEHRNGFFLIRQRLPVSPISCDEFFQAALLLHQFAETVLVERHVRARQLRLYFFKMFDHVLTLFKHGFILLRPEPPENCVNLPGPPRIPFSGFPRRKDPVPAGKVLFNVPFAPAGFGKDLHDRFALFAADLQQDLPAVI